MTELQKNYRNQIAQQDFDFYVWNGKHLPEYILINRLYDKCNFTKSIALKQLDFIKRLVEKEYNKM